jgi:hypothetical protein
VKQKYYQPESLHEEHSGRLEDGLEGSESDRSSDRFIFRFILKKHPRGWAS